MYNFSKDDLKEINRKIRNMNTDHFAFNDYIPTSLEKRIPNALDQRHSEIYNYSEKGLNGINSSLLSISTKGTKKHLNSQIIKLDKSQIRS